MADVGPALKEGRQEPGGDGRRRGGSLSGQFGTMGPPPHALPWTKHAFAAVLPSHTSPLTMAGAKKIVARRAQ